MKTDGFLAIGKIVGCHGVKGALKVYSYAESPSIFRPDILILLRNVEGREKTYSLRWAKPHGRRLLFSLKGIDDRNSAGSLIGSDVFIEQAVLPEPEEGSFYWSDIIGLSVYSQEGAYLGRVTSILPTGSNDVYVVQDEKQDEKNEILIPALESVVLEIDLEKKRLTVNLPEGL